MAPDVLRNIVGHVVGPWLRREAMALVEPRPEVDQTAFEGAERPVRIVPPYGPRPAAGTPDSPFVSAAPGISGWRRFTVRHPRLQNVPVADKACQLNDFRGVRRGFGVDTSWRAAYSDASERTPFLVQETDA